MHQRLIFLVLLALSVACSTRTADNTTEKHLVLVHMVNPPAKLNPVMISVENEDFVLQHIFQPLLRLDLQTSQLQAVLVQDRPSKRVTDTTTYFSYQIRPQARWADGKAVTARDVLFTLKVIKNPYVDCKALRGYLAYIQDVQLNARDSLAFTLVCGPDFILSEATSGDFYVLPEHLFDPEQLMESFSLQNLYSIRPEQPVEAAQTFANRFNKLDFSLQPELLKGSGPYHLQEWRMGEIGLLRNPNWWGSKLPVKSHLFHADPELIIFRVLNDYDAATYAMKTGQLDVMKGIPASKFDAIYRDSVIAARFTVRSPEIAGFFYLGLNSASPKLSGQKTRKAIAHLVDRERIIEIIHRGFASIANGAVLPSNRTYCNTSIVPYDYNPNKAKSLLQEDGWRDKNGDGVMEKNMKGEEYQLELTYLYPSNSEERKAVGVLLQESFSLSGIPLTLEAVEFNAFGQRLRKKEFEMMVAGRTINPIADDPENLFSTRSIVDGANYVSFGNDVSDKIIEGMRRAPEKERIKLSKSLQAMVHEDASFVFLFHPRERILVNKRLDNVITSHISPRIWPASMTLRTKK